ARAWFTRALTEPRSSDRDVELVSALATLALIAAQPAERDRLLVREHDTLAALVGPDHILTLDSAFKVAMFTAHPGAAARQLRDVCQRMQTFHAREIGEQVSLCAYD